VWLRKGVLAGIVVLFSTMSAVSAQDEPTTRDLVDQAREAAVQDDNHRARQLFEAALAGRPTLRRRLLREYADQVLYSGGSRDAIPLYHEYLSFRLIPAEDRDRAERNLVLAYAWAGQHDEAVRRYDALLARHPRDAGLLIGKAEALGWSNRNADAAETYSRAFRIDPALRGKHLAKLADQLLWAGGKSEAIALYREVLSSGTASAEDRQRAGRNLALALAWSGRHREAIAQYDRLLAERPRDGELLVGKAQALGWENDNAAAADTYRRAFEADPALREKHLGRYAEQILWAGGETEAIPLFHEALARGNLDPKERRDLRLRLAVALSWSDRNAEAFRIYETLLAENPDDMDARIGAARVMAWQGDLRTAEDAFRKVLEQDPDNAEAWRGLAQVRSWRGRHRGAVRDFRGLLEERPKDPEARRLLAQTLFWMGRSDRARIIAEGLSAENPDDGAAKALMADIRREMRPRTEVDAWVSTQSDGLVIATQTVEHVHTRNDGLTKLGITVRSAQFLPDAPDPPVRVQSPGFRLVHRFGDWARIDARADLNILHGGVEAVVPTYDAYATFEPSDLVGVYVGSRRVFFDNIESLVERITATYASLSVDVRPTPSTTLALRGDYGWYTDGNRRVWGQAHLQQLVLREPNLFFGVEATAFRFEEVLDNGYWNPRDARVLLATAKIWDGVLANRLWYEAEGGIGGEWQEPGGFRAVWRASAGLTYVFSDQWEGKVRVARLSPLEDPQGGGLSRTTVGLTLGYRW